MPSIKIQEANLTRGTSAVSTDIPFIPGFVEEIQYSYRKANPGETATHKYDGKNYISSSTGATHVKEQLTEFEKPVLCSSVRSFETLFGKNPHLFKESIDTLNVKIGDPDKSYIMAKELLARGMSVYYYAIPLEKSILNSLALGSKASHPEYVEINADTIKVINNLDNSPLNNIFAKLDSRIAPGTVIKVDVKVNSKAITNPIRVMAADESTQHENSFTHEGKNLYKYTNSPLSDIEMCKIQLAVNGNYFNNGEVIEIKISVDITNSVQQFLTAIFTAEGDIADKDEYSIKYITTGGYPNNLKSGTTYLYDSMIQVAASRGDAIALVEDVNDSSKSLDPDKGSFFKELNERTINNGEYAASFTPWANYILSVPYKDMNDKTVSSAVLPACFGYLADLALNIKTSPNWLAMAGITRGRVPNIVSLHTTSRLSNTIANRYQPTSSQDGYKIALNAITDIKPYGLTIWGNRTLKTIKEEGLDATNFLNTRNMISDIKKVAYRAAKAQLFEQNSETLWLNFKSEVSPFLEQLKKGNGISDYKLLKLDTKYNGNSLGKEEFACAIKIYPLYAVESFEITVVVSDNDVSVG